MSRSRAIPVVLLLALFFLLPPAFADNLDQCPGCMRTTLTAMSSRDGDQVVLRAGLFGFGMNYYLDQKLFEEAWRKATEDGNYFDPASVAGQTNTVMPLEGKEILLYRDTNRNGIVDPADDELVATLTTDSKGEVSHTVDVSSLPNLECSTFIFSYIPQGADVTAYREASGTAEACGNFILPLASAIDPIKCLPVILLLGLLAAAMYASGKNPTALLDISTPRGPRPKPYGMRKISINPGGVMQRMAQDMQKAKSLRTYNAGTRKAMDLANITGAERRRLEAFLHELGWMRHGMPSAQAAAALRLYLSGITNFDRIRNILADMQRQIGDNVKRAEGGQTLEKTKETAYNNALRGFVERGSWDGFYNGKLVYTGGALSGVAAGHLAGFAGKQQRDIFAAVGKAAHLFDVADNAIMAGGKAFGMTNFLGGQKLGEWIDKGIEKSTGVAPKGSSSWKYRLNVLPRMAEIPVPLVNYYFVHVASQLARINKMTFILASFATGGPKGARDKVAKAIDARREIAARTQASKDALKKTMGEVRKYLKIIEDGKAAGLTKDQIVALLVKAQVGTGPKDKSIEAECTKIFDRLSGLTADQIRGVREEYVKAQKAALQIGRLNKEYEDVRDSEALTQAQKTQKDRRLTEILKEISELHKARTDGIKTADKALNGELLRPRTQEETAKRVHETVHKVLLWEMGKFCARYDVITQQKFEKLIFKKDEQTGRLIDGELVKLYKGYQTAVEKGDTVRAGALEETLTARIHSELLKPLAEKLQEYKDSAPAGTVPHGRRAGPTEEETMRSTYANVYSELSMMLGYGGVSVLEPDSASVKRDKASEGKNEAARLLVIASNYNDDRAVWTHNAEAALRGQGVDEATARKSVESALHLSSETAKTADPTNDAGIINMSGIEKYIPAMSHLSSPSFDAAEAIMKKQILSRFTMKELAQLVISNSDQTSLQVLFAKVAHEKNIGAEEDATGHVVVRSLDSFGSEEEKNKAAEVAGRHLSRQIYDGSSVSIDAGPVTTKEVYDSFREQAKDFFAIKRRSAAADELRQALVEKMGREEGALGVEGMKPYVEFVGGQMLDMGDFLRREERYGMMGRALANKGIVSGSDITMSTYQKHTWIATPDEGFIVFDEDVMKDSEGHVKFTVGGMHKVVHGVLEEDKTDAGSFKIRTTSGGPIVRFIESYIFKSTTPFTDEMMVAKAVAKLNKQEIRAASHGPVATLGLMMQNAATGVSAGEYSVYSERKAWLVEEEREILNRIKTAKMGEAQGAVGEENQIVGDVSSMRTELKAIRQEKARLDVIMQSRNEVIYHDAFFSLGRHFREIDDTLTAGKTQRALSSGYGATAYTDTIQNFGLSAPWQPSHSFRGRIPMGTAVSLLMLPAWIIGVNFTSRMRPFYMMAAGMPTYVDPQGGPIRHDRMREALRSLLPNAAPKFWHITKPISRAAFENIAVETDADISGGPAYNLMQELRAQARALKAASEAARDATEKARLKAQLEIQLGIIEDERRMLRRGYYRELDPWHFEPDKASALLDYETAGGGRTGVYRSIYLKYKEADSEALEWTDSMGERHKSPDQHVLVDRNGNVLKSEANKTFDYDTSMMRTIPPAIHKSIVGSVPMLRVEDYSSGIGILADKYPGMFRGLARLPVFPAFYDFDVYEPDSSRHGVAGMLGTHYAYHAYVGSTFGLPAIAQGALSVVPIVGPYLGMAAAYGIAAAAPWTAPLSLSPSSWGGKTLYVGEYVEEGLAGGAQAWSKWNATYEQLPLYRVGEDQPVAGITYFSPYKYMDPSLVYALEGSNYSFLMTPHEYVTAYPGLIDEFNYNIDITELMWHRKQELEGWQRYGYAQLLGAAFLPLGLVQSMPRLIGGTAGRNMTNFFEQRLYGAPTDEKQQEQQAMLSRGVYHTCWRCGLMSRTGHNCISCGSYVPLSQTA